MQTILYIGALSPVVTGLGFANYCLVSYRKAEVRLTVARCDMIRLTPSLKSPPLVPTQHCEKDLMVVIVAAGGGLSVQRPGYRLGKPAS